MLLQIFLHVRPIFLSVSFLFVHALCLCAFVGVCVFRLGLGERESALKWCE